MSVDKIFIKSFLNNFEEESFSVKLWDEEEIKVGQDEPLFKVTLNKPIPKKELLSSATLAFGEAYMDGNLQVEGDFLTMLNTVLKYKSKFPTDFKGLPKIFSNLTSQKKQKEEVSYHYDLGNDFYHLWLDETMSYSCGYFQKEDTSLFEAQVGKVDHILKKLQLKTGMTLLDIGCGWGFLMKRAVVHYGVKAVGITLSQEQFEQVSREIEENHLQDRMTVKLMDYRELKDSGMMFDRAVSVGMLEHVGRGHYGLFLEAVQQVLKPGGLFLLHYISAQREHPGDPWIRRYIFPGGVIPSLREIVNLLPEQNFYLLDGESLRRHYTKTLLCWRENFLKHREELEKERGQEFVRMWELYLASCAAAFHNGIVDLHQLLLSKGVNNELPMIRTV